MSHPGDSYGYQSEYSSRVSRRDISGAADQQSVTMETQPIRAVRHESVAWEPVGASISPSS